MDMTGSQKLVASREDVYAALNNPDVLKQCIPGCETIEKLSDTQMRSTAILKVGPVKASFKGLITLSDLDPPNGYKITGEGSGGAAGFAKGSATVRLIPDGNQATLLEYAVKADVGGRLTQLGGRLIDATANKLASEFFEKFGTLVGKPQVIEGAPAATAVEQEGPLRKWIAAWISSIKNWLSKFFGTSVPSKP